MELVKKYSHAERLGWLRMAALVCGLLAAIFSVRILCRHASGAAHGLTGVTGLIERRQ